MAYVSKETKSNVSTELKKIIPKGWKWSLAVRDQATLILTISAAPVDLVNSLTYPSDCIRLGIDHGIDQAKFDENTANYDFYMKRGDLYGARRSSNTFKKWEDCELFGAISKAMNLGNYDNSDSQSDYFDCGWGTRIQFGACGKPFWFDQGVAAREEAKEIGASIPVKASASARATHRI